MPLEYTQTLKLAMIINRSPDSSSNPDVPGLALLASSLDNAGIASFHGKLHIFIIYCHCLEISHE
jgi:hypothetical protein